MLASILNKYSIKHNIQKLPPPGNNNSKHKLITKLEQIRQSTQKENQSYDEFIFPYIRWDQFLKVYMDDLIFGVPKDSKDLNKLMSIITILVLSALQEVGFIISGSKVSLEHT